MGSGPPTPLPGWAIILFRLRARKRNLAPESPLRCPRGTLHMSFLDELLPPIPPAIRVNARTDLLAAILFGLFSGLTTPFIAVMGRRLGASALAVSFLVAAPAIVLVLSLWWANLIRLHHPVSVVVYPALVGRALFLLMPLIHTPMAFIGLVVLYHAITSIGTLGYAQVMRLAYPEDLRGRIMGSVRVGMALAWILGSLVGGPLMQLVPFQWVFAAAAGSGMASSLVFRRMHVPSMPEETRPISAASTWLVLREDHAFRRFLGAFFAFGFGAWLIAPAIPILLVDVLAVSNYQVGLLGAVTSGTWLLSYRYWGKMIDERSASSSMVRVFLIGALTPLIYLLAWAPWMILLAGTTDGLTSAGVDLGWVTAVLQYAPPRQVRHYVGIYNTFVGVRAAVAPLVAGLLIPVLTVRPIFAIGIMFTLAGAALMRGASSPRAGASTA